MCMILVSWYYALLEAIRSRWTARRRPMRAHRIRPGWSYDPEFAALAAEHLERLRADTTTGAC